MQIFRRFNWQFPLVEDLNRSVSYAGADPKFPVALRRENCESGRVKYPFSARARSGRKLATSRTPDGKMPHESKSTPREIQNYLGRVSGPLLDRIDLHVEVPQVKFREISGERTGETSAQIRERVVT